MTISQYVKSKGLKSVDQMSQISGKARSTLNDWYKKDIQAFDVMLVGCLVIVRSPFGNWVAPQILIKSGYKGAVVVNALNRRSYAARCLDGRFFHYNNGSEIDLNSIIQVMAYDSEAL